MPGQKRPLNEALRSLFSRIQREFHAPTVFAAKIQLHLQTQAYRDTTDPRRQTYRPPGIEVHSLPLAFSCPVQSESLATATCRRDPPLESLAGQTYATPLFHPDTMSVHLHANLSAPARHSIATSMTPPHGQRPSWRLKSVRRLFLPLRISLKKIQNTRRIHEFGIRFSVIPFKQIKAAQAIRYRTQVLKKLGRSQSQLIFIGLCPRVPPARLRLREVVFQSGVPVEAWAVIRGLPDYRQPSRTWVLVQERGSQDMTAVFTQDET
jgi:hypothetical protein